MRQPELSTTSTSASASATNSSSATSTLRFFGNRRTKRLSQSHFNPLRQRASLDGSIIASLNTTVADADTDDPALSYCTFGNVSTPVTKIAASQPPSPTPNTRNEHAQQQQQQPRKRLFARVTSRRSGITRRNSASNEQPEESRQAEPRTEEIPPPSSSASIPTSAGFQVGMGAGAEVDVPAEYDVIPPSPPSPSPCPSPSPSSLPTKSNSLPSKPQIQPLKKVGSGAGAMRRRTESLSATSSSCSSEERQENVLNSNSKKYAEKEKRVRKNLSVKASANMGTSSSENESALACARLPTEKMTFEAYGAGPRLGELLAPTAPSDRPSYPVALPGAMPDALAYSPPWSSDPRLPKSAPVFGSNQQQQQQHQQQQFLMQMKVHLEYQQKQQQQAYAAAFQQQQQQQQQQLAARQKAERVAAAAAQLQQQQQQNTHYPPPAGYPSAKNPASACASGQPPGSLAYGVQSMHISQTLPHAHHQQLYAHGHHQQHMHAAYPAGAHPPHPSHPPHSVAHPHSRPGMPPAPYAHAAHAPSPYGRPVDFGCGSTNSGAGGHHHHAQALSTWPAAGVSPYVNTGGASSLPPHSTNMLPHPGAPPPQPHSQSSSLQVPSLALPAMPSVQPFSHANLSSWLGAHSAAGMPGASVQVPLVARPPQSPSAMSAAAAAGYSSASDVSECSTAAGSSAATNTSAGWAIVAPPKLAFTLPGGENASTTQSLRRISSAATAASSSIASNSPMPVGMSAEAPVSAFRSQPGSSGDNTAGTSAGKLSAQKSLEIGAEVGGRKRALLIGINYSTTRETGALHECINDVRNLYALLTEQLGFPAENIWILTDEPHGISDAVHSGSPTKSGILNGMHWLSQAALPGDTLFFSFSGHGSQTRDENGDEDDDGLDETILPYDHETEGEIVDDEIHNVMVKGLCKDATMLALFDCCNSGTVMDLPYIHTSRTADAGCSNDMNNGDVNANVSSSSAPKIRNSPLRILQQRRDKRDMEVTKRMKERKRDEKGRRLKDCGLVYSLCGCADFQKSADAFDREVTEKGIGGGAMTCAFVKCVTDMRQRNQDFSLKFLLDEMTAKIRKAGHRQRPYLSCSRNVDIERTFEMFGN